MTKESQKLEDRILEDGRQRARPIKRRAQRKADEITQDAREEGEKRKGRMREEAREEAEQEAQRILARAELEAENIRRRARESVLSRARQLASEKLQELANAEEHLDCLVLLAIRSLKAMRGQEFDLVLPRHEKEERGETILEVVTQRAEEELAREVSLHPAEESASATGGLLVRRRDGEEICDQTFDARLERLWPQIRTEIADDLLGGLEGRGETPAGRNGADLQNSGEQTPGNGADE